jgi:hypothetical protein
VPDKEKHMKHVKIFGLAALAATALMVVVASSASATMLYNGTPHNATTTMGVGAKLHAELEGTAELEAGFLTIKCTTSTFTGTITNAGSAGNPVVGTVNSLTFGSCNCGVVKVSSGGTLEAKWTAGEAAELISKSATAEVECLGTHCNYVTAAAGTRIGTLNGSTEKAGGTATFTSNTALTREAGSGGLCNASAAWKASYKVNTPDFLDVTNS